MMAIFKNPLITHSAIMRGIFKGEHPNIVCRHEGNPPKSPNVICRYEILFGIPS